MFLASRYTSDPNIILEIQRLKNDGATTPSEQLKILFKTISDITICEIEEILSKRKKYSSSFARYTSEQLNHVVRAFEYNIHQQLCDLAQSNPSSLNLAIQGLERELLAIITRELKLESAITEIKMTSGLEIAKEEAKKIAKKESSEYKINPTIISEIERLKKTGATKVSEELEAMFEDESNVAIKKIQERLGAEQTLKSRLSNTSFELYTTEQLATRMRDLLSEKSPQVTYLKQTKENKIPDSFDIAIEDYEMIMRAILASDSEYNNFEFLSCRVSNIKEVTLDIITKELEKTQEQTRIKLKIPKGCSVFKNQSSNESPKKPATPVLSPHPGEKKRNHYFSDNPAARAYEYLMCCEKKTDDEFGEFFHFEP